MKPLLLVCFLFCTSTVFSQVDSSAMLHVNVEPLLIQYSYGRFFRTHELPSNTTDKAIAELLRASSTSYVKSYGKGSLATVSLRGGSASQTKITWQGLDITNPMLGLKDLSLIRSGLFNSVKMRQGGLSAEEGSGAITGTLAFANSWLDTTMVATELTASISSFGGYDQKLSSYLNHGILRTRVTAYREQSKNDFDYQLAGTTRKQTNAEFESKGLLVETMIESAPKNKFTASYWLQDTYRQIPPVTTQNNSTAFQEDFFHRAIVGWKHKSHKFSLDTKLGYFDEDNDFTDPDRLSATQNHFIKWQHLTRATWIEVRNKFSLRSDINHTTGDTKAYSKGKSQQKIFGLYGEWQRRMRSFTSRFGLRKEWNNIQQPPLIPTFSLEWQKKRTSLRFNFSREYRNPTLNELYWSPGGDETLKPEQGWNQELTFLSNLKIFSLQSTLFHRKLENWILWAPLDGSALWSATNLSTVRSHGLDMQLIKKLSGKHLSTDLSLGYTFVRSQNLSSISALNIKKGDQLIYTPRNRAFINAILKYKKIHLGSSIHFTDSVRGINENLKGYTITNIYAGTHKSFSKRLYNWHLQLDASINNLTNANYRIVERRPQPGRHFNLTMKIKFEKK